MRSFDKTVKRTLVFAGGQAYCFFSSEAAGRAMDLLNEAMHVQWSPDNGGEWQEFGGRHNLELRHVGEPIFSRMELDRRAKMLEPAPAAQPDATGERPPLPAGIVTVRDLAQLWGLKWSVSRDVYVGKNPFTDRQEQCFLLFRAGDARDEKTLNFYSTGDIADAAGIERLRYAPLACPANDVLRTDILPLSEDGYAPGPDDVSGQAKLELTAVEKESSC
jgi:hypothetical protein